MVEFKNQLAQISPEIYPVPMATGILKGGQTWFDKLTMTDGCYLEQS
jgi:hypothetical protein